MYKINLRKWLVLGSILLFVATTAGTGWAMPTLVTPFGSTGYVNPNYNDSWNPDKLTGTALFELLIDPGYSNINVYWVSLELEDDVFNVNEIDANDFTIMDPFSDWNISIMLTSSNVYKFAVAKASTFPPTPLTTANGPVKISFDYVLMGADRFSNASGNGWEWDEGQPWAVTYTMLGNAPNTTIAISGGSTAPVPEPATIILMGTGLLGFGGMARKKIFNAKS